MAVIVFPVDAVSSAPTYTGEMTRQALGVLIAPGASGRPLGGLTGVTPGTSATTVTATSTVWTCNNHGGILDLETSATAGPYHYAVNTAQTGSVTAANASNPRIDIVYVQVSDPAEGDGSSTPSAVIAYLAGTAAASPVAPATPARSMVLAQINVPKSGSGSPSVSWVAPYTSAAGGIVPCASSAYYPANPYEGMYVDDASLNCLLRYSGSAWQQLGSASPNWTNLSLASGFTNVSGSVAPRVCLVGPQVVFEGKVQPTSGNFATGSVITICTTLPTAFQPAVQQDSQLPGASAAATARAYVLGATLVLVTGSSASAYFDLKGLGGYIAGA